MAAHGRRHGIDPQQGVVSGLTGLTLPRYAQISNPGGLCDVNTQAEGRTEAISVQDFDARRRAGWSHVLLDVRECNEVELCALDGALHIPMSSVPARQAELPVDTPLVVMCHHGMRSMMVMRFLQASGFSNVLNLEGGIDAWAREVDASIGRY